MLSCCALYYELVFNVNVAEDDVNEHERYYMGMMEEEKEKKKNFEYDDAEDYKNEEF